MRIGDLDTLSQESLYNTVVLYIGFWKVLFYVGTMLSIGLNSMIFIDLWLTLRNPFYPRRKRNKYYNMAIIGIIAYLCTIMITNQRQKGTTLDLYDFKNDDNFFVLGYKSFFIVLLVCVCFPMIMIIWILCRRGTSRDLRLKIFKYQVIYFFLFLLTIFAASYDLWDITVYDIASTVDDGSLDWISDTFDVIFNAVGIPMALNRLFEPYVWREFEYQGYVLAENCIRFFHRVKVFFQLYCCCRRQMVLHSSSYILEVRSQEQKTPEPIDKDGQKKKKRKKYDYSQDTLDSFLNSAMNIEMVYLILLGISNFMESTSYNRVA